MERSEAIAYLAMLNDRWPGEIGPLVEEPYIEILVDHTPTDAGVAFSILFRESMWRPGGPELVDALVDARNKRTASENAQRPALPQTRMTEDDRTAAAAILHEWRKAKDAR